MSESPGENLLDVQRVKDLREAAGLSQQQAAERAGFPGGRQQWNSIERGTRASITLETLAKMAAALGVQPAKLLRQVELQRPGRPSGADRRRGAPRQGKPSEE